MTVNLNTTTNNAFQYPTASNDGSDFATGIADLAADVDGMWSSGTLVSLPAAGTRNRVYYATDAAALFVDNGSSWDTVFTTGDVKMSAAATAPAGWLNCNGSAISRTTYAHLFAVLGTSYGAGNGTTTFNLPDFTWAVPVGIGQGVNSPGAFGRGEASWGTPGVNPVNSSGFNNLGVVQLNMFIKI